MIRQIILVALVSVAVFVLLIGLTAIADRSTVPSGSALVASPGPSDAGTPPAALETGSQRPPPDASGATESDDPSTPVTADDPVLVGAGDIALCDSDRDDATADLIEDIDGTVFTTGDNAYQTGTAQEFRDCYGPSWGRFRDRTHPSAGDHDWGTPDLAGYRGYFGDLAGPPDRSWYSYDLGWWHVVVLDSQCDKVGGCRPDSRRRAAG